MVAQMRMRTAGAVLLALGVIGGPRGFSVGDLSVVLVTSPIPSHPSCQLIDEVISSFDLIDGLQDCPLIIVADGVKVGPGRSKWNKGKVDEQTFEKYLEYISSLRCKYEAGRSQSQVIGPLEQRVNFGHALLRGLQEVKTELVLVVQHDRVFAERFSMHNVVKFFDTFADLRYVGFQTVPDYMKYAVSKLGGWARSEKPAAPGLIPCFMWYDSTHVCRTQQLAALIKQEVRPGEFIDSSYGCRLLDEIRARKEDWSWEYHMKHFGLFLYCEPQIARPMVRHVSGRGFHSKEQRLGMGWPAERPLANRP
ncbi:unnamed protein product [Effrenium voratum]|nr:unnamed protein product [Effrenium voratum]